MPQLRAGVLPRSTLLRLQVALQGNYLMWTGVGALPRSTLLRLQLALQGKCPKQALGFKHFAGLSHSSLGLWALHKGADSVGRAFCALPRSEQLRRPGAW